MKRLIYIVFGLFLFVVSTHAQDSMSRILESIELNNTQLKAQRELSNAQKIENKTTNNLENPEAELRQIMGRKGEGSSSEFGVSQAFDFPTAYKHRSQMIGMQNEQLDFEYDQKRREILQEARTLCISYVYQATLHKLFEERVVYARDLYSAYQNLFDKGDIDILERNKTKINLLNAEKELQMSSVELNSTQTELQRMNGGEVLSIIPSVYDTYLLPLDFDSWFQEAKFNNPTLKIADKNISLSRKQEQLARSLNLPKLSAGYAGNRDGGITQHGFTVGVSIPLWGGRNTVRSKQAQTVAYEYERQDSELQYKNVVRVSFDKAQKLSVLLKEYGEIMNNSNNYYLLKKAFDKGQLSLINYIQELVIYHEAVDQYLEAERDYFFAVSELQQWER